MVLLLGKFETVSQCLHESWVLFSLVSDPSHAYITSLIRQSMISLEGGKMWRKKKNHSVLLKDCIVFVYLCATPTSHAKRSSVYPTLSTAPSHRLFFSLCLRRDRLRRLDQLCLRVWEKLVFYAPLWRRDRPVLRLRVDVCR